MKTYKWVVEIEIDPLWVADGFDLTDARAHSILRGELPYAHSGEITTKVLSAPDPKQIRCEQGYHEPGYKPFGNGER